MKTLLVVVLSLIVVACALAQYQVQEIPSFGWLPNMAAFAINNQNQVVGSGFVDNTANQFSNAFRWSLQSGTEDLGLARTSTPSFYRDNQAPRKMMGINDTGTMVFDLDGPAGHNVVVTSGFGNYQSLQGFIPAINNNGWISGMNGNQNYIVWRSVQSQPEVIAPGGGGLWSSDISDMNVVAGSRIMTGNIPTAFTWSETNGVLLLPLPREAFAVAINNSGYVVGNDNLGNDIHQPIIWLPDHSSVSLGFFGGFTAYSSDINNLGDMTVIGIKTFGFNQIRTSGYVRSLSGEVVQLPDLPGFANSTPTGINDQGWVCGYASDLAGNFRGVVWNPVPEPSTLLVFGLLSFRALRRRR